MDLSFQLESRCFAHKPGPAAPAKSQVPNSTQGTAVCDLCVLVGSSLQSYMPTGKLCARSSFLRSRDYCFSRCMRSNDSAKILQAK